MKDAVTAICLIGLLFWQDWRLALVTAVAVLLGYLARLLLVERAYKHGLEVQVAQLARRLGVPVAVA